jgi:4-amino-4-deoxy-L-arabinose transferase-like glycosyltransferase
MLAAGKGWMQTTRDIWTKELVHHDGHMMQVIVALATVIVSISIGYLYAHEIFVEGWQLWTWLLTVVIVCGVLLSWPERPFSAPSLQSLINLWPFLALIFAGLLLRVLFLEMVPGGLHVDEMGLANFTMLHVFPDDKSLTISPFRTGWSSQPSLHNYLVWLVIKLAGYSIAGLRLSSAIGGTIAIFATYAVVAVFQDRRTALIAAVIITFYHYHIHWSRLALNNIWDTVWVPLMLAAFAWGWRRDWSGGAVLAGLAAGLAQYFYAGNKIGLFLFPLVLIALYQQQPDRRRLIVHLGKFLAVALTVAAPILIFALLEPDLYLDRTRVVMGWTEEAITTTIGEYNLLRYLVYQLWHNFGAFTSVVDITGFYGPGVPFLIGLAAPLFVIGFFWAIWKRHFLPVAWVLLTVIFGGIMLTGAPSSSHYVVVIPAICWLVAIPIDWLWEKDYKAAAIIALVAIVAADLIFYFTIYVPSGPRDLFNTLPPLP